MDGDQAGAVELYLSTHLAGGVMETEQHMNRLGYDLLARKRADDAVAIFKLNVEKYPHSANVHDSLGEAYLAIDDLQLARVHFKRSIALDPDGPAGKNSRNMLQRIDQPELAPK